VSSSSVSSRSVISRIVSSSRVSSSGNQGCDKARLKMVRQFDWPGKAS
jgi:hypothetical protein